MSPLLRTRAVEVATERLTLSGLLAEPDGEPRALVVALHGHGMTARYFSGPANPDLSLLELGAALGFTVWAPDRPGYGTSVDADPASFAMFTQADILNDAIHRFTGSHAIGAGCFLIGHSFGLKIALTMAASATRPASLMGVDGSGSGLSYTFQPGVTRPSSHPGDLNASWGPKRLYPATTFTSGVLPAVPTAPTPEDEGSSWPDDFRRFATRIRVPVRFTFGDHERLWVIDQEHFDALRALLDSSPRVDFDIQLGAGHNISLSHAARAYHLKALAFAEECVLQRV